MKYFNLLLFSLIFSLPLSGQYSISGSVKNQQNEVMISALVWLEGTDFAAVTDESGKFRLSDLPLGTYSFKVSYIGYRSLSTMITIPFHGTLDVVLQGTVFALDNVEIRASKVVPGQPFTYTNLDRAAIQKENLGVDMPFLLQWTPSLTVTSDAGAGIGYTGMRLRGTDQTRLNVTINGVPLNDAESQDVFWVDLPDLSSSVSSIQIQRGVGPSTNGPGAFGGSVGVNTHMTHIYPYVQMNASAGSFATRKFNLSLGSGLINDKYSVDARYSTIQSDGYMDRATSDLKSWYFSAAKLSDKSSLRINAFSGKEITYQSWNGVPEARVKNDQAALLNHYYNNLGSLYKTESDSVNLFSSDRRYNYYTYPNQVDNYTQTHVQLHHSLLLNKNWKINSIAYYTKGSGYFEQFRNHDKLENYGLDPYTDDLGNITERTDVVRRRWLDNDLLGVVMDAAFDSGKNHKFQFGAAGSTYAGDHFGNIVSTGLNLNVDPEYRYYDNTGKKTDMSAYARYQYTVGRKAEIFTDVQLRRIQYSINGIDQDLRQITLDTSYMFFNPKAGINFDMTSVSSLYFSYSVAQREPTRADFLDNAYGLIPRTEWLGNLEAGLKQVWEKGFLNINLYLMDYKNQLVLAGDLNDVGAALRTNVGKSYRLGLEIDFSNKINNNIILAGNLTLSRNKIRQFDEILFDYTDGFEKIVIEHKNTDIAFSPSVNGALQLLYMPFRNFEVELSGRYVGAQFLDNTSSKNRKLDPYHFQNLRLAYLLSIGKSEVHITGMVNNLINRLYSSNGYTYSYIFGDIITENFLYPQAGRNWMLGLQVRI